MKRSPLITPLAGLLAVLAAAPALRAEDPAPPAVQMSPYDVTAPKFTSPFQEFYEKLDNLFDGPWVDTGRSGALIEAIIWRHGYLAVHPSDQAVIYVERRGSRVLAATNVYTAGERLYANSWALGERVRLPGLTAADVRNEAKVRQALRRLRGVYALNAQFAWSSASFFPGGGSPIDRVAQFSDPLYLSSRDNLVVQSRYLPGPQVFLVPPVLGDYTALPDEEDLSAAQQATLQAEEKADKASALAPERSYRPFLTAGWEIFAHTGYVVYTGDGFHESGDELVDTVYRELSDPAKAGRIPVGLGYIPVNPPRGDGSPGPTRMVPVVTFDWEGVHYVYRPYHGTAGSPIERNPVTGLPYLYVKDNGLMESIYFCATYPQSHPGERAVLVPGATPAAAYTIKGRLGLFCPALNKFAASKTLGAGAIDRPERLTAAVAEMQRAVAARGRQAEPLTTGLRGDTPDAQMRRTFLAFEAAGLAPRLKSSPGDSSLTFTWQGATYVYGQDQRLARLN
jgi:hypothetical protein